MINNIRTRMLSNDDEEDILNLYNNVKHEQPEYITHIPTRAEIKDTLNSKNSCYMGAFMNNKLMGILKISKATENSSGYFRPPKQETDFMEEDLRFIKFDELLMNKYFKETGHEKQFVEEVIKKISESNKIQGIFASFDCRNSACLNTMANYLYFIGFVDRTNNSDKEKSSYITLYRSLKSQKQEKIKSIYIVPRLPKTSDLRKIFFDETEDKTLGKANTLCIDISKIEPNSELFDILIDEFNKYDYQIVKISYHDGENMIYTLHKADTHINLKMSQKEQER